MTDDIWLHRRTWWAEMLSWKLARKEVRWLFGVADARQSRHAGLLLAAVAAAASAALGVDSLWHGHAATGCWRLVDAVLLLGLGCLLLRGKSWAAIGLMAVYTVDRVAGHVIAATHGDGYYTNHAGFWLSLAALTWAMWMQVFSRAFRAEQERGNVGEAPASPER